MQQLSTKNCSACGQSVSTYVSLNQNTVFLCQTCYGSRIMCAGGCGTVVKAGNNPARTFGQSRLYGYSQLSLCVNCYQAPIRCGVCNIPAARAANDLFPNASLLDGQIGDYRCAFCGTNTINQTPNPQDLAQGLFDNVYNWVYGGSNFGLVLSSKPTIVLTSQANLLALDPNIVQGKGFCRSVLMNNGTSTHTIYIATYLRPVHFLKVAAHEITHPWQHEQPGFAQSSRITEGFAEWVAYKFLQWRAGTTKNLDRGEEIARLLRILKDNPDPNYGGGLRYFLGVEDGTAPVANNPGGILGVLALARTANLQ